MTGNSSRRKRRGRRVYTDELKAEAVQMLLDGHRAESVAQNLGLTSVSLLYRWRGKLLRESGRAAPTLEGRVRQLEQDLRRVERERDDVYGKPRREELGRGRMRKERPTRPRSQHRNDDTRFEPSKQLPYPSTQ